MKKTSLVTATTFTVICATVPALADDPIDMAEAAIIPSLPAVSQPNWKVGFSGGQIDLENRPDKGRFEGEASLSLPLTHDTGVQLDGSLGSFHGDLSGSGGAHLFTRDPATHLLGIWTGYSAIGKDDIFRIGPEAEYYLGDFTLQGTVGYEFSNSNGDDAYAYANLAYYPMEDLKLYLGYRRSLGHDAGAAGFEWLIGGPRLFEAPMSLFAEGQYGENEHTTLWAGIRFYFGGPDKSLQRRHREDDPVDPNQPLNRLAEQCVPFVPEDAAYDSCGGRLGRGGKGKKIK